jgi:hypothetical protein
MLQANPAPIVRRLTLIAAMTISTGCLGASAQAFDSAFASFEQALSGSEAAINQSAQAFSALLAAEPGNPVLMAYAGASTAMRANTTWLPWRKMTHAEDGLALLDKALAMLTPAHNAALQHDVPAALEVRFVAANTFLAVPGFMNRGARGSQLLADVVASPLLAGTPVAFRGNVWLVAAEQASKARQTDEARRYLTAVIEARAPQAAVARARLAGLAS